jgi:DNA-binding NarL/FixJ family response regulator
MTALAAEMAALRMRLRSGSASQGGDPDALTDREKEVLELVSHGLSNKEIATRLFISAKTASVHVSNILRKTGAASRTEAAYLASRRR